MTQPQITIFAGDTGWRLASGNAVHDVPSAVSGTPAQIAREIATIVGSSAENVTLALPSSWCLSATVSLTGVPVRNRRTSLLYRLELLLPLTAEDLAADYILNDPDSALAICTSIAMVKPFIDAIEAEGIVIQSVVPASLFAASTLLALPDAGDLVIWQSDKVIELFISDHGKITVWFTFPAELEDLRWHLDQLATTVHANHNAMVYTVALPLLNLLKETTWLQVGIIDDRSIEQVVCSAIATGQSQPVNLRQSSLAPDSQFRAIRRPLNEAMMAALFLVACFCGAACWHAVKLERLAESNRDQQRKLFLQLFPGHTVPTNIVSRLRSEDRALENGNANAVNPPSQSALPILQTVLTGIEAIPQEVRLQVDDLKVDNQKFSLEGVVKTRSDLTNVVDALQQTSRLKLDPPQTEQTAGKTLHISLSGVTLENPQPK